MMPGMDGFELCKNLKNDQSTSHIPIILLTAKGSETDEIEGLETGADDYIFKPFKFSILKARVNSLLENRRKISDYFSSNVANGTIEINQKSTALPDREVEFLQKLEKYILDHCLETEVSVFDLASGLGFSRTTLYRKIKALTGMSINAFVRSIKIKESTRLIEQGMNVSEAAYSTGFTDLKYFRESFKKQVGKNPSEFKN
jgi:response regulator RpfG family c-di-GMP phosphodiesterase